jgi:hypothetical protein
MPLDSSRIPRPMKMVARPRRHLVWSAPPSFIPGPHFAAASSRLGGVSQPVPLKSCLRAPGSGSTSKSVSFPDNYLTVAEIWFYEPDGPLPRYPWMDRYFRWQFGSWPHQRSISSVSPPVDGKEYCIRLDRNPGRLTNSDPTDNTGSAAARIVYLSGTKEDGPLFRRFHWTYPDTTIK